MIVEVARITNNSVNARIALGFQGQSAPTCHCNENRVSIATVCLDLLLKFVGQIKDLPGNA